MNRNLENALLAYCKGSRDFTSELLNCSNVNLIGMFSDLITMYVNDLNSSTLREMVTLVLAGYEGRAGKIGYNGYKIDDSGKCIDCEVKPKNVRSHSDSGGKLNGGGNFTDYTWKRFEKDKEKNPNMLVSGFVDGKIIYIFEFPFNLPSFVEQLKVSLRRHFPKGDKPGGVLKVSGI